MSDGKSSVEAVTFDLWETLLLEKDGWDSRRTTVRCCNLVAALEEFGVQVSFEKVAAAFDQLKSWLISIWELNNDVTHYDQIRFLFKAITKGHIAAKEEWIGQMSSAVVSAFFEVPPYLNLGAPKVLASLKKRGNRVGLICNTGLTPGFALGNFLRDAKVGRYFDLMLFSDEVGIRKPNPMIFQLAAQNLRLEPGKIVHVGDNLKADVWGAKNAGFKAVFLSTNVGRDKVAEGDPNSLVSYSRRLGNLREEEIVPDKTITSLAMSPRAIAALSV